MFSKYISYECLTPVYLLPSEDRAKMCGKYEGYVVSCLGILICVFIYIFYKSYGIHKYIPTNAKIITGCIILLFMFLPKIFSNGYVDLYYGYKDMIANIKNTKISGSELAVLHAIATDSSISPQNAIKMIE
jgi:hypothetical protein